MDTTTLFHDRKRTALAGGATVLALVLAVSWLLFSAVQPAYADVSYTPTGATSVEVTTMKAGHRLASSVTIVWKTAGGKILARVTGPARGGRFSADAPKGAVTASIAVTPSSGGSRYSFTRRLKRGQVLLATVTFQGAASIPVGLFPY